MRWPPGRLAPRRALGSSVAMGTSWQVDTDSSFELPTWLGCFSSAQLNGSDREHSSCRSPPGTHKAKPEPQPVGHRGPGSACRQWCNPFPVHLPRGSSTSEFGFLRPALAAWRALHLRLSGALASTSLAGVPADSPCCPRLSTGGPRCRLWPAAVHSAPLAHVVTRAGAEVRPEPSPGSEAPCSAPPSPRV